MTKNKKNLKKINFRIYTKKMTIKESKSKFVRVKCNDCGNEQVIFGNCASTVKCLVCDKILATPTGGKSDIKAEILEVF